MKLGVFDSGLGGLLVTKGIRHHMPDIDMLYYGDTLHLPYGSRSAEAIYGYAKAAMDDMFQRDCRLIVMACNTACAAALRRLQQEYLPERYPERRILGVIVPTLETALEKGYTRIGLLATRFITESGVYGEELNKINPDIRLFNQAAPLLVPMMEQGGMKWIRPVLESYLAPLLSENIECLLLGCTHYPYLEPMIREIIPDSVAILRQDRIVPPSLADYLKRHPEISRDISRRGQSEFFATDITESYLGAAQTICEEPVRILRADRGGRA